MRRVDYHRNRRLPPRMRKLILGALSIGADRQMAAHLAGMSLADLRLRIRADRAFRNKMRRREAACELNYLRVLLRAAERKGGERVAMWWLERRAPDRFGRRLATSVSTAQLDAMCEELIDGLQHDVVSEADRARIIGRIARLSGIAREANITSDFGDDSTTNPYCLVRHSEPCLAVANLPQANEGSRTR